MADNPYLTVPKGLTQEVSLYLQALQDMTLDLAGYRQADRRAIRLGEMQRMYNEGKLWPAVTSGTARHGETVKLGSYSGNPVVFVTGFEIPVIDGGTARADISQLRPENGAWMFDAEAICQKDDEKKTGSINWIAIGSRNNA